MVHMIAMDYGDTFVSDVMVGEGNNTVMGTLGGKDWPVGEPAGVKIHQWRWKNKKW